jgi:hypothetical protein
MLKHRVELIGRKIDVDADGNFHEKYYPLKKVWARLVTLNKPVLRDENVWGIPSFNGNQYYYRFVMQKIHNINALHADLYGLIFNCRKYKILRPFDLIQDGSTMDTIIMDEGTTDGMRI